MVDIRQVSMPSTGYPSGKQGGAFMDTADMCLGSQRSLDADTEAGL